MPRGKIIVLDCEPLQRIGARHHCQDADQVPPDARGTGNLGGLARSIQKQKHSPEHELLRISNTQYAGQNEHRCCIPQMGDEWCMRAESSVAQSTAVLTPALRTSQLLMNLPLI